MTDDGFAHLDQPRRGGGDRAASHRSGDGRGAAGTGRSHPLAGIRTCCASMTSMARSRRSISTIATVVSILVGWTEDPWQIAYWLRSPTPAFGGSTPPRAARRRRHQPRDSGGAGLPGGAASLGQATSAKSPYASQVDSCSTTAGSPWMSAPRNWAMPARCTTGVTAPLAMAREAAAAPAGARSGGAAASWRPSAAPRGRSRAPRAATDPGGRGRTTTHGRKLAKL